MGAIPPPNSSLMGDGRGSTGFRLNLDRFGMPRDYATYVWLLYKKRVVDESPARRAFENGPEEKPQYPRFGQQTAMR